MLSGGSMILRRAEIRNFRLLRNVALILDNNTTLIVGKNNSGKTSFSQIIRLFMKGIKPDFDDFSLECHQEFFSVYRNYCQYTELSESEKEDGLRNIQSTIPVISLDLLVEYNNEDNWSCLKPLISSLSESNVLQMRFEYSPTNTMQFLSKVKEMAVDESKENILKVIKQILSQHYQTTIKPVNDTEVVSPVDLAVIKKIISVDFIDAQRSVEDSNSESNSKLSSILNEQYKRVHRDDSKKADGLQSALDGANDSIDLTLSGFFERFIGSLQGFGYPALHDNRVEIKSQLNAEKLFTNNVKLYYRCEESLLPERYNGLGYSNLFFIIAKIFDFITNSEQRKADLRLLFIEEPEAHMHPQMQTLFIRNIESFLKNEGFSIQLIVTTHSSHILAHSDFMQVRYFSKSKVAGYPCAIVKDLRCIDINPDTETFLKQYLSLEKCDLFFADKALLVEGTVERLLLPIFIKKIEAADKTMSLSEQYLSVIEIGGAYMHRFKEILDFIGLRTLVITDIDSVDGNTRKRCPVEKGKSNITSNAALSNWIPALNNIDDLLSADETKKIKGQVRVAYQTIFNGKCGRSFEEAFIIENSVYIHNNRDELKSIIGGYSDGDDVTAKSYEIQDFIDRNRRKTDFAFDLLSISQNDWIVPSYIQDGLSWLSQP